MATKKTTKKKAAKKTAASRKNLPVVQIEVVGARPDADDDIDEMADEMAKHRSARLKSQGKEQEADGKIVALAIGKGLVVEGGVHRYVLRTGKHLVIRPKQKAKMGAYIEDPPEEPQPEPQVEMIEVGD